MLPAQLLINKLSSVGVSATTNRPGCRQAVMVAAVAAPVAPPKAVSLRVVSAADLSQQELQELTARPRIDFASILDTVGPCPFLRKSALTESNNLLRNGWSSLSSWSLGL